MARRYPVKINSIPVAGRYMAPNERVIEFSSPNGGGLISFRVEDDGTLTVEPYRLDETVNVNLDPHSYRWRTIRSSDVGASLFLAFGRKWPVSAWIGRILPGDIGKRVYLQTDEAGNSDHLTVENNEQRDARIGRQS